MKPLFLTLLALLTITSTASAQPFPIAYSFPTPNPPPDLPNEMDTFTPPPIGPCNGPSTAEFTHTAGPDEVLTLAGPDFRASTLFRIYGQTAPSNAAQFDCPPCVADAIAASFILPASLPTGSMYLVWPTENEKSGPPIAVNRTDAWWIGPDRAVPGDTVAVYGRNLSHRNGATTAWVYLNAPGHSDSQWIPPTQVNHYKVTFILPTIAPGHYEIWLHNGHGGPLGWSGPLPLNVLKDDPFANQSAHLFNVKTYGATADGLADDTVAVQKALVAAANAAPATLYFPAGTYSLNQPILPRDNVSWAGEGRDRTIIQPGLTFNADRSNAPMIFCMNADSVHGQIEFRNLTFAWNPKNKNRADYDHLLFSLSGQDTIKITNCRFNSSGHVGNTYFFASHMQIADCEFIGDGIFFAGGKQIRASGNHFRLTDYSNAAIGARSATEIDISSNTAQDQDPAAASIAGVGSGRFFCSQCLPDSNRDIYIADNTTINMAPPKNIGDPNQGEQILFEVGSSAAALKPLSSTPQSTTFDATVPTDYRGLPFHNRDAFILSGRGAGQSRQIIASNGKMITVSPPWSVLPDATSVIGIGPAQTHCAVYHNTLDGKDNYAGYQTASVGIQMYGNVSDVIFANNSLTRMRNGISSEYSQTPGADTPTPSALFFNLITENTLDRAYVGCNITTASLQRNQPGLWGHIGNTYRHNQMTNILSTAIALESEAGPLTGGDADQDVFDHNTITGTHHGLALAAAWNRRVAIVTHFQNTILYANTFDRGQSPFTGSIALSADPSSTFWTANNRWLGFETGTTNENSVPSVSRSQ